MRRKLLVAMLCVVVVGMTYSGDVLALTDESTTDLFDSSANGLSDGPAKKKCDPLKYPGETPIEPTPTPTPAPTPTDTATPLPFPDPCN